ncbi:hypothetical protein F4810DRAFT_706399 [Camillea tinctor]|nr:hypothetical protein F4810DRAFT_706399 [Camillea tinctor]
MTLPTDTGQINAPDDGVSPLLLSSYDGSLDAVTLASDSRYYTSPGNSSLDYGDLDRRGSISSTHGDMYYGVDASDMFDSQFGFHGHNVDGALEDTAAGYFLGQLENDNTQLDQYSDPSLGFSNHVLFVDSGSRASGSSAGQSNEYQQPPRRLDSVSSSGASPAESSASHSTQKCKRDRERNRVAAHKCRQKAKHNVDELQKRERELSQRNKILVDHAGCLREEILGLKTEILRHSSCNSEIIQNYIAKAARDI